MNNNLLKCKWFKLEDGEIDFVDNAYKLVDHFRNHIISKYGEEHLYMDDDFSQHWWYGEYFDELEDCDGKIMWLCFDSEPDEDLLLNLDRDLDYCGLVRNGLKLDDGDIYYYIDFKNDGFTKYLESYTNQ